MYWIEGMKDSPKDGREILIYIPYAGGRIEKVKYSVEWDVWVTQEPDYKFDEFYGIGTLVPTHWMNLPEFPKQ